MKNDKGFTLLEAMAAITIISIGMWAMMSLFTYMTKSMVKMQKKIEQQKVATYGGPNEPSSRAPLLCLSGKSNNDFALVCQPSNPCSFQNGVWKRGNEECSLGVFFK